MPTPSQLPLTNCFTCKLLNKNIFDRKHMHKPKICTPHFLCAYVFSFFISSFHSVRFCDFSQFSVKISPSKGQLWFTDLYFHIRFNANAILNKYIRIYICFNAIRIDGTSQELSDNLIVLIIVHVILLNHLLCNLIFSAHFFSLFYLLLEAKYFLALHCITSMYV